MNFSNSYVSLGENFYERIRPTPVQNPQLFLWNDNLAEKLMIPDELRKDSAALSQFFSGSRILPGSEPIATAYAGHQFGSFVHRVGGGRKLPPSAHRTVRTGPYTAPHASLIH